MLIDSGNVYNSLLLHPDNEHIIYPLGSTVVVRHILSRTQTFLRGHDNQISGTSSIIQLFRSLKMESTSQVPRKVILDSLLMLLSGISKLNKSNTDSNYTNMELSVLASLQTHKCLPLRVVLKISISIF